MLGAFATGFFILIGMEIINMINDKKVDAEIAELKNMSVGSDGATLVTDDENCVVCAECLFVNENNA